MFTSELIAWLVDKIAREGDQKIINLKVTYTDKEYPKLDIDMECEDCEA